MKVGDIVYCLYLNPNKSTDKESLCYHIPKIIKAEIEGFCGVYVAFKGHLLYRHSSVVFDSEESLINSLREIQ